MESTTTPGAYYQPPPEKLAKAGMEQRSAHHWQSPTPEAGLGRVFRSITTDGWLVLSFCSPDYAPRIFFRGRLRTEAEFDLLFWQIGWTDVEPTTT